MLRTNYSCEVLLHSAIKKHSHKVWTFTTPFDNSKTAKNLASAIKYLLQSDRKIRDYSEAFAAGFCLVSCENNNFQK